MGIYAVYLLDEDTISIMSENAPVEVNKNQYIVTPDIKEEGKQGKHGVRIKIQKKSGGKNNSQSHADTISIPFSIDDGTVILNKIKYGNNIKNSDKKEILDIGIGIGVYCFEELKETHKSATPENVTAFNKKAKLYGKLSKSEMKEYIKKGYGKE